MPQPVTAAAALTCLMCKDGRCADCLNPECRCCSAPRGEGEDMACQHEWDEMGCLKCGESEA